MNATLAHFERISRIPRPSKHEERIRQYLTEWAWERGFETAADRVGNLVVRIPATADRLGEDPVILQSHMDMVCVKLPQSKHDFDTDPIEYHEEGGWIRANGTTLGADNGIGMALALASVEFASHPPLELLFTADEEQGMSGALGLDTRILTGKKVINLDSEDEGEICVSSAGWAGVTVRKAFSNTPANAEIFSVRIFGMKGGHSGVEIHENRGNAISLLSQIVLAGKTAGCLEWIVSFHAGVASNVIPSNAQATVSLFDRVAFERILEQGIATEKSVHDCPDIDWEIELVESAAEALRTEDDITLLDASSFEALEAIVTTPLGVRSMSDKIEGLVQTSLNVGTVRTEWNEMVMQYAPRSSIETELRDVMSEVSETFRSLGFTVVVRDPYPGWQQDPKSPFVQKMRAVMMETLGVEPRISAVHAGLECGAIVSKLGEGAEAISVGPTVVSPHTVNERCEVATVVRMERVLETYLAQ